MEIIELIAVHENGEMVIRSSAELRLYRNFEGVGGYARFVETYSKGFPFQCVSFEKSR